MPDLRVWASAPMESGWLLLSARLPEPPLELAPMESGWRLLSACLSLGRWWWEWVWQLPGQRWEPVWPELAQGWRATV